MNADRAFVAVEPLVAEMAPGWSLHRRALGGGVRSAMLAPAAGDTIANNAADTPFASRWPVPASDLADGDVLRVTAAGVYSISAVAPSLRLALKYGTATLVGHTVAFGATARTNRPWRMDVLLTVVAAGTGGLIEAHGAGGLFTAPGTASDFELFNTAAIAVDTTTAKDLAVWADWSVAGVALTITQRQFVVSMW